MLSDVKALPDAIQQVTDLMGRKQAGCSATQKNTFERSACTSDDLGIKIGK
jgi:hypothetical protein